MDIVEGKSGLWDGIGEDKKECIRGESSSNEVVLSAKLTNSFSSPLPDSLIAPRS